MQEAIKKRLIRAKSSARKILESTGYDTIISDNQKACLIGFRSTETRIIRVMISKPSLSDIEAMKKIKAHPEVCKKEIWVRKLGQKSHYNGFEIVEV